MLPEKKSLVPPISASTIEKLRRLDSCTVSNAIEGFHVRLRNEGFMFKTARCRFPQLGPMVGYAVTGCIRSSTPPVDGRCYYDRADWWQFVQSCPAPRILVLQDADRTLGLGAFVGEIHANICLAIECIDCVTNGSARDLDKIGRISVFVNNRAAWISNMRNSVAVGYSGRHAIPQAFAERVVLSQAGGRALMHCVRPAFAKTTNFDS